MIYPVKDAVERGLFLAGRETSPMIVLSYH